jgi:Zn finger protein HypA/HybF involved in hydrogenase expression
MLLWTYERGSLNAACAVSQKSQTMYAAFVVETHGDTMRKCPKCSHASNKFTYRGWVVRARGVVEFGEHGVVSQVGPAVAETVVKAGQELKSDALLIVCPQCGHENKVKHFVEVRVSYLSGRVAEGHVVIDSVHVPIANDDERSTLNRWISEPLYAIETSGALERFVEETLQGLLKQQEKETTTDVQT